MIRERRSREKLEQYYRQFVEDGVLNPNVHPWVAESWQSSLEYGVPTDVFRPRIRLTKDELAERRKRHKTALDYIEGMFNETGEYFNSHNLSLLILDSDCYALENYALPFYQKSIGEIVGVRLLEQDIGTSSISIAYRHQVPFLLFGPEIWIKEFQWGDAASAPIMSDGRLKYILTLVAVEEELLSYKTLAAHLLTMKYGLEKHLADRQKLAARHTILDSTPFAVYQISDDGAIRYTNKLGRERLAAIGIDMEKNPRPNIAGVVLNYHHTPLYKGFNGIPSYNKEVTWITSKKTYEDITTVVPLERDDDNHVNSIVAVSMPIEDLRTLVAHAVGYTARYSLACLVGEEQAFTAMKDKAERLAKGNQNLLLQGEAGSGKARLAHAIHQASPRAAGPLISLKCADVPPELIDGELFGLAEYGGESRPGKLELASGGTLFLDEIEKLPYQAAAKLAETLARGTLRRTGETIERAFDVRIIAACDSDLKRLTEKELFPWELYQAVAKNIIRIPPLRLRREDVPLLAEHIIAELAEQHHMPAKRIADEAKETLKTYDWPGNIKQLQGVMEHAFFNTSGDIITKSDIKLLGDNQPDLAWKEDREVFLKAWQTAGGNISRLANMLNVSRVTLYRYLKKFGIGDY